MWSHLEQAQRSITVHNELIYENLFPFLESRQIPFVFASSQLVVRVRCKRRKIKGVENDSSPQDSAYGLIKRRGEEETLRLGQQGRVVRYWNVYGEEPIGTVLVSLCWSQAGN